jgi:hypothetical protein
VLFALITLLLSQVAFVDILPYEGSTMTLLIIAAIAVVALAFFRLLVPLIIAAIVVVVLIILVFGGIPVPSLLS